MPLYISCIFRAKCETVLSKLSSCYPLYVKKIAKQKQNRGRWGETTDEPAREYARPHQQMQNAPGINFSGFALFVFQSPPKFSTLTRHDSAPRPEKLSRRQTICRS